MEKCQSTTNTRKLLFMAHRDAIYQSETKWGKGKLITWSLQLHTEKGSQLLNPFSQLKFGWAPKPLSPLVVLVKDYSISRYCTHRVCNLKCNYLRRVPDSDPWVQSGGVHSSSYAMGIYTFYVVGKGACYVPGSTCIVSRLHIPSKEICSKSSKVASGTSELLLKVIPGFRNWSSRCEQPLLQDPLKCCGSCEYVIKCPSRQLAS